MKTKIKFRILTFTSSILFILPVYAALGSAGFSQAAPMKLYVPTQAQSSDQPLPEPRVLTDEQDKYTLGLHLEILEDPGGELTIEEVSSPLFDAQFVPSRVEVPNVVCHTSTGDCCYSLRLPQCICYRASKELHKKMLNLI